MISIDGKKVCAIIFCVGLVAGCSAAALAGDTITGVARNQTRGRVAIGDEVILLRLDQRVHEEARTKTDSQGSFLSKLSILTVRTLARSSPGRQLRSTCLGG